jgi:hypothetical protein
MAGKLQQKNRGRKTATENVQRKNHIKKFAATDLHEKNHNNIML